MAAGANSSDSGGFSAMIVALIGADMAMPVGAIMYLSCWWIRRQNPALFRKYD